MAAISQRVRVKALPLFSPLVHQCRLRSKINIKKPKAAHLDRRIFEAVTVPVLDQNLKDPYASCPRLKRFIEQDQTNFEQEENEYEQFITRQCKKIFEENATVLVYQPMPISGSENTEIWRTLFRHKLGLYNRFSNRIVRKALADTKWINIEPLLVGRNVYVTSPEVEVKRILAVTNKIPELVVLGGFVGDSLFSRDGLLNYAKLPTIQALHGELSAILNHFPSRTVGLLNQQQSTLSQNLEQYVKDHSDHTDP